jgi:uncharacterized protein YbjQ (UPF0145 family)
MKAVISEYIAVVSGETTVDVPSPGVGRGACLAIRHALEAGRATALTAMDDRARELGAHAVVGVDLDSDLIDQRTVLIRASGMAVRLSCGTAVRIVSEPPNPSRGREPNEATGRRRPVAADAAGGGA